MAYDVKKIANEAITILENNVRIITDLQLYGRLGVSPDWFYATLMKSDFSDTIESLMRKNKANGSSTATDCLWDKAVDGDVKAATTLGRIADTFVNDVLAPQNKPNEDDGEVKDIDAVRLNISKLMEDLGYVKK